MKEYNKDNSYSNDNKLFHVLQQFSQYEARMYEQAIIHSVEPALNVGQEVSFNINWDSTKEFLDNRNTTPIQAITRDTEKVYDFSSIRRAGQLLDIDKRNIQTSMNYITYHKSDVLGEYVRFVDNTKPILNVGVQNKDHLPLFSQIDYTSIPEKQIWAYDDNFNKVGEYSTSGEAAKDFNITRSPIKNNINKKFTKCIVNGLPSYFVVIH